jgi:hypothetical protein
MGARWPACVLRSEEGTSSGESGGADSGSGGNAGRAGISERDCRRSPPGLERTPVLRARARHGGRWMES